MGFNIFITVISSAVFFVNLITILKQIKREENTLVNTWFGAILLALIVYAFLVMP